MIRSWLFHPYGMFRATTTNTLDRWAESKRPRVRTISRWLTKLTPNDWENFFY